MKNFVEKVLGGEEFHSSIDEYVECWHNSQDDVELHDYLGFSYDEYALWVENPDCLKLIFNKKEKGETLCDKPNTNELHLLAARSNSQHDKKVLVNWLKDGGYI